ncbi:MAG TPA: GNAT family N-acetyltransferase [Thermoanaerobaculia bacterium]|nr:GNAT family N-acetyltransferase [Thermoanaerobaculia bacterium]
MPTLLHDAERILRECFRNFAAYPGATIVEDSGVFGVMTNLPISFFSGIAATDIGGGEDVDRIAARFRRRGLPFRWWLTPSVRPPDLETLLLERGFRHTYDARGMVADLDAVDFDTSLEPGVVIRRLTNLDEFEDWLDVFILSFARPAEERAVWREAYEFFGFDADAEWTHFVGYRDGAPVSTTSVLHAGDLGGIYQVATVPQARGRGIGRAVTLAAMKHARHRGARRAVLQSSEMGFGVYRAIGFEDVCPLRLYDWRPEYER